MFLFQCWCLLTFLVLGCFSFEDPHFMSTGENPEDFVKSKIDSSDVMVFARSYGPHNQEAKELLDSLKKISMAKIEYLDVDLLPGFDGALIMTELQRISGQWSLPNIYIGKKHVGGNSELEELNAIGKLTLMVKMAGGEL